MSGEREAAYRHCEAVLREADRDAWLATLFVPAEQRPRLHAIGAFAAEIRRIKARVHQPLAGEIRIQWWQDVLDGARSAEAAAHPVAAALLDVIETVPLPRGPAGEMLDAHRLMLYDEPPADLDTLQSRLAAACGAPLRLAALSLGGADVEVAPAASAAGVALGIEDGLRALAEPEGRAFLPDDLLARHGVSRSEIEAGHAGPTLRAALVELRGLATAHLSVLHDRRKRLGPSGLAFLPAALVAPRLALGARAADPLAPPPDLSAWRRLLRLWRTARNGGVT